MGEAEFGLVDGVLATTAGWIDKYEVVKLRFDPRRISFEDLVKKGASRQCAQQVFTLNDAQQQTASGVIGAEARRHGGKIRPDKQPKYYLFTSPLQFVPMTELQAVRINARMKQKAWRQLLSPGQLEILEAVNKHPKAGWPGAVGVDVAKAWTAAEKVKRKL